MHGVVQSVANLARCNATFLVDDQLGYCLLVTCVSLVHCPSINAAQVQLCMHCRDDLEQVRILADQCRRREKLRKRGLATWQQDMQGLLLQAITLDQQLLGTSETSSPAKAAHAGKLTAAQGSKKQPGSKGSHSKAAQSKQLLQLVAEIADATENAQAKFEHDMALSLQLTNGVADEAAKLHRVKIVRAESSHSDADADDSELPSEAAQEAAQVVRLLHCFMGSSQMLPQSHHAHHWPHCLAKQKCTMVANASRLHTHNVSVIGMQSSLPDGTTPCGENHDTLMFDLLLCCFECMTLLTTYLMTGAQYGASWKDMPCRHA